MQLRGREFFDFSFAREISNRVYKPDPRPAAKPVPNPAARMPKPTAEEVERLIVKWLQFCEQLDLNPGGQTNVAEVDWVETFRVLNARRSQGTGTLNQIQFKNGTVFSAMNDIVFGHFSGDAAFLGEWAEKSPEYWKSFVGKFSYEWRALSEKLNTRLVQILGVSGALLSEYIPTTYVLGSGGVTRCVVRWCHKEDVNELPPESVRTALSVEFDLATGEIKSTRFDHPLLLKWK